MAQILKKILINKICKNFNKLILANHFMRLKGFYPYIMSTKISNFAFARKENGQQI